MRKSGRINWTEPAASWSEKEVFNGSVEDSLVIILRTKGCSWHRRGGCLMCGYHFDSDPSVKDDDVLTQLESALGRIKEEKIAKLYNSGSFFDEEEISGKLRKKILEALEGKVEKLVVETRPEFISDKPIKDWWISLWNSTAPKGYKWEDNPYVFVYEFERVENVD